MRRALLLGLAATACDGIRATIIDHYPTDYGVEDAPGAAQAAPTPQGLAPTFDGPDATRPQAPVRLTPVLEGLREPTDVRFLPGRPDEVLVAEKQGLLARYRVSTGQREADVLDLDVLTRSEQGLLGVALHPAFAANGRFYVNHTVERDGASVTRISEYTGVDQPGPPRVLLEVEQPYGNHNAGQLAFGPDGYLYVGLGDGGWRDDPKGNGQNPRTRLGSMLRIDVDAEGDGRPYGIPADNPFLDRPGVPPETWAIGLRNPWRYSFDPEGRLVVADVGQNTFEEVNVVSAGDNLGWKVREGRSCFPPGEGAGCAGPDAGGFQDPVYVYDHEEGASITGGFVYQGSALPALRGRYVFADFASGRLWAISLPPGAVPLDPPVAEATALGRFSILPSTFAQGPAGELFVADYQGGTLYRLAPSG